MPPGRFCFSAMKANKVGHELPSLRVRGLCVRDKRGFEGGLRALSFLTLGLPASCSSDSPTDLPVVTSVTGGQRPDSLARSMSQSRSRNVERQSSRL